jgi:SNF2 family DNA or RNA helicase
MTATAVELKPLWRGFEYLDHQVKGVKWMLSKEMEGTEWNGVRFFGGLQCDDMGLGKTIQMTSTILHNPVPKTILLVPLAMIETWRGCLLRAKLNVFLVNSANKWEVDGEYRFKKPCVYITNYEKTLYKKHLFEGEWNRIVLDESHKIRTRSGAITKAVCEIVAPIRWAMTGTPLVNSLHDVATQFKFVGVPIKGKVCAWSPSMKDLVPQIVIHRDLEGVVSASDLPRPVIEQKVLEFGTGAEKRIYRAIQGEIKASRMASYASDVAAHNKMLMLLRLRQASIHPQIYISSMRKSNPSYGREDWTTVPAKFVETGAMIRDELAVDPTHKYIVFCQFHEEMSLLKTYLEDEKIVSGVEMYHGKMSIAERDEALRAARLPSCQVLLIQIHSGGVGLNLQEFDRCIFLSPWWTAALMSQAIARTVRMGQKRVVRVVHLTMAEEKTLNIDRLIMSRVEAKREALKNIFLLAAYE